ncbi:hypothetical protein ACLOJK_012737 [Asimina triloba]
MKNYEDDPKGKNVVGLKATSDISDDRKKSSNEKNPRRYHSGSVYKSRNRSRSLHGIGQPYMKGKLCRFRNCADE